MITPLVLSLTLLSSPCWETEWKDDFNHNAVKTSTIFINERGEQTYLMFFRQNKTKEIYLLFTTRSLNEFSLPPCPNDVFFMTRIELKDLPKFKKEFGIIMPKECLE